MKRLLPLILGLLLFGFMEAQNVVFHEDFEQPSGADSVTAYSSDSGNVNTWGISTDLYAGGLQSDSAICSPYDTLTLTTSAFSTVGNAFVLLDFDHICKIEALDMAIVEVSTDNGQTWNKLDSTHYMGNSTNFGNSGNIFNATSYGGPWKSGQAHYIPDNTWWKHETFNISPLAANSANVQVRFSLIDVNGQTSFENYGWFIDNIEVSASPSELVPPVVNFLPPVPQDTVTSSSPQTVMAKITDNSGIDTAYLVYYVNGNLVDTLGMTEFATDSFSADIPFVGFGRTVTWFVKAIDMATAANITQTNNYSYYLKYLPLNVVQVGTGTITEDYPFYTFYHDSRTQILLTATELQALGATAGAIDQIGFDVTSAATQTMNGFNIEMKHTSANTISSFSSAGFTNVYTGTYTVPGTGWQMIDLQSSFAWDGVSNILINICFDNTSYTGSTSVNCTSTPDMTVHEHADNDAGCSLSSGTPQSNRPNVQLRINVPSTLLNDVGVAQIVNPTGGVVANSNFDVKAKIKNFGIDTVTSAEIKWQLDGNAQTTYNYTGSLLPDSLSAELTLGTLNVGQGPHHLKLWTDNPNNTFDDNTSNDTMSMAFYGCDNLLSGTYTIGGSNPDYATFADAAMALNQCGIDGPVTFNVSSGTYNEQISIGQISGSSATNTVTFQSQSGDSTDVNMEYSAAANSDNYLVELDGTSNIVFKDMTFEAMGSGYSRAVVVKNYAENVTLTNNRFMAAATTTAGDEMTLVYVDDTLANNFIFTNNNLINGSSGLLYNGDASTGVTVTGNNLTGQFASGLVLSNTMDAVLSQNTMTTGSTHDSFNALVLEQSSGNFEVAYNNVQATNTSIGYGISLLDVQGDSLNHGMVYNNMLLINGDLNTTTLSCGILNMDSRFVNYYHNTVKMTGNDQNSPAFCIYDNSAGQSRGLDIRNNIFTNFANGYVIFTQDADSSLISHDYNNLYAAGSGDFINFNTTIISDIAGWQTATGEAANSISVDPYFVSSTDLHITNNLLDATATPVAGVTDDIDGDSRDATTPDMGADEFDASPYDLAVLDVYGPQNSCGLSSSENITIKVKNIGSSNISSFDASYMLLNDSTTVTETVNTTINTGDTLEYTFSATVDMNMSSFMIDSTFDFKAWVSHNNDPVHQNDSGVTSVLSQYQPPAPTASGFSITYGDSITITATSNDTLIWYETDTSSSEIATGKYFTTPQLYDTTTYWVSAIASTAKQPIITEICHFQTATGSPTGGWPSYLEADDYIEITGSPGFDLEGITLEQWDGTGLINSYTFPQGTILSPNGTAIVAVGAATTSTPSPSDYYYHADVSTSFASSTATGRILKNDKGEIIDAVGYSGSSSYNFPAAAGVTSADWSGNTPTAGSTSGNRLEGPYTKDATNWINSGSSPQDPNTQNANLVLSGYFSDCESPRVPVTVEVTGIPTDNAGISAIQINSGCGLSMEPVTIDIYNNGSAAITGGLTAAYKIDNGPYISPETVNVSIAPKDTVSFTFSALADLSAPVDTTYEITAYVSLLNDTLPNNDTLTLPSVVSLYTPPAIVISDTTVTYGSAVTRSINSNATVFWYANDTTQTEIHKGNTFTTPLLYDTLTYYIENSEYSSMNKTIGSGSLTQNYAPAYGFYDYGWSNMLYLNAEIGGSGVIDTLKFDISNSVSGYNMPNQKIYMANTSANTLTSAKPDPSTMTLVYDGSVNWSGPGWFDIILDTPFEYDGQGNLQIYYENRDGNYSSGYPTWVSSSVSSLCYYDYQDGSFPTTTGSVTDRPNIVLSGKSKGCTSARVPWTINVLGQPNYDAALLDVLYPNSGIELSFNEPVTISIWNSGAMDISNFAVSYKVDNGTVITDTVTTTIPSGDTLDYTFTQSADLSTYGTYNITAWASLDGDSLMLNDTVYKSVTNNPLVYCHSGADNDADTEIDEVIFNTISNNTAGVCATYSDFTSISTNLLSGQTYQLSVTLGTCGSDFSKSGAVFFDWNHDGDFDDANESGIVFGPTSSTQTFINNVTVPANAASGNVRMRIVCQETSTPSAILPCGNYSYGETEDYTLVVIPPIPQDAGVTDILAPQFYGNEGDQDTLDVTVRNFGTDTIFSVDVNYTINGGTPVSYTVNDTILPQTNINVQLPGFSRPADTSTICAYTVLAGDSNLMNDQSCQDIYGLPLFDANVINVHPLAGGCDLSTDTIRVDIKNSGADTLMTGFNVKYMINDVASTIVTESVNSDILPDSVYTYEFAATVDLTVTTFDSLFKFTVWTEYANDNNPKNDTNMTEVLSKHTPATPIVNDTNINYGTSADIIAQATAPVFWYDSLNATVPIHIGDTLTTPLMFDSAVYYYEAVNGTSGSPIIISEYSSYPDLIEITNVSNQPFDATGWQVLMNDNTSDINYAQPTTWQLGQFMSNEVIVGYENAEFGSVGWVNGDNIWVMLVDDQGNIMDFVASNWTASDIQGMSVNSGGFTGLNPGSQWTGDGVVSSGDFIIRQTFDVNDSTDWTSAASGSAGTYNPGMVAAPGFSINGCNSTRDSVNVNVVFPNDNAGITDIMTNSGCKMTNNEPVTIAIVNAGANTITTGLTAKYKIDNGSFITPEQVNMSIPSMDTVLYTFNTTANLAAGANDTSFVITAVVDLPGDTYATNDSIISGTISSLYTPSAPVLTNPTITYGKKATLNHTSTDSLFWYVNNSITNEFHIGNSFTTPILYDTTTYYVEQTVFSPFSSQIATGTQTTNYIPAYGYYDYGWSNTLYLSNELGSAGMIDTIYFYVDNSVSGYVMPDQKMYLANSSASSLSDAKPDPANMTQVFNGAVDWNGPGWFAIPLDNSFFYDGQKNLQIYWENHDGDWSSGYPAFRGSSISGDYAVYDYQDNSFPTSNGSFSSVRPNIKLAGNNRGCGSIRVPWTVNVIGHPPIDGQLAAVLEPKTAQLKTDSEPVIYRIKNNGTDSLANVKVGYIFDGQQPVEENLSVNMGPGDTLVHTFASTVNMAQFKSYPMISYVNVPGDTVTVNDTISRTVTNKLDYCISTATNTYDDTYIETVTLNGLNNTSTSSSANYTDFTASVAPAIVYPSVTHPMTISMDAGTVNSTVVKVFIDANRDGVLDETTETFMTETINSSSNKIAVSDITLPANAAPGLTLMRIVLQETSNPSDVLPCGTYSYGETEDYLVQITPMIPQDAGIIAINKPNKFMINANQQFEVEVKNFGSAPINGLDIQYTMGTSTDTYTYNGTIAPQDTAVVSMSNLTMPYGNHMLCVNTVLANDSNTFNDSHCKAIFRQMTTNPPYFDDFEGKNVFMRDTASGKVTQWEYGTPKANHIKGAHSGQTAWMIDLDSNYNNSATDVLYSPKFATGNTGLDSLVFWHYMDAEAGDDGGYVQYQNVTGHWTTLGEINDPSAVNWYTDTIIGQHAFSGNTGWIRSSICIDTAHVPNMASITQFRFVFASDGSGNSGDGWAIDDFQVKIPRVPYDAGISAIINPAGSSVTGATVNVEVRLKNFGYDPLTATDVTYQVGNNTPVTESWTGNLLTDSSEVFAFSTPYTGPSADYELSVYTELSNDGNLYNDTLKSMIVSQAAALDAGVIDIKNITNPQSGPDTTWFQKDVQVVVTIRNFGSDTLSSFDVEYQRGSQTPVTETWTGSLMPDSTVDYTFSTTYSSGIGKYDICGRTLLTNDADPANDEYCEGWVGVIYNGIESSELAGFVLHQNIPNPSNGFTSVGFEVPYGGKAEFNLIDLFGRTLYNEQINVSAGSHSVKLDVATIPAGVYYYSVTFEGYRLVRKMIVSK